MCENKEVLRAHFDGYSTSWHHRVKLYPYFSRFRAVGELTRGEKNARVLDIGCGTGDYAVLFDPQVTDYLGMDISPRMVEEASRLYPRYSFMIGDGEATGLPDGHFDMVLSIAVMEYLGGYVEHMREISRIAAPGATLMICVPNADNTTKARDKRLVERLGFIRDAKRAFLGGEEGHSAKDPRVVHRHYSLKEMEVLGDEFGLTLKNFRYVNLQFLPMPLDQYLNLNPKLSTYFERDSVQKRYTDMVSRYATILVCKYRKMGSDEPPCSSGRQL